MNGACGSSMCLGDLTHDSKAEPSPFWAAGDEWLEKVIAHRFGHSVTCIGHGKNQPIVRVIREQRHAPADRRVLDCVEGEVVDRLGDALR
jgi:hypothetical protein